MNALASLLAHASTLPHTHEGSQTNWLPAIGALAALALASLWLYSRRKASQN